MANITFTLPNGGKIIGIRVEHPETEFWFVQGQVQLALDLQWCDELRCRCATVVLDNKKILLYENGEIFVEEEGFNHGIEVLFS